MEYLENSVSVEEVQVFCIHSDDCMYHADSKRDREVFVNWDHEWIEVRIVFRGDVKALMLFPVIEVSKVQLIMGDEEFEEEGSPVLEDESVN